MNEIIKAIKERRSIRKFTPEMPKREDLDQIIDAGLYAASAKGQQDAIIVAVTNRELRERLSAANCAIGGWPEGFDPFYGAPVILIVLAKRSSPNRAYDGALVMGNLMLAAHALGLGSIWINRAREEFDTDVWQKLLADIGVEGEWEGVGHCAIGVIDGEIPGPAPRKPGRVYWVE